MPSRFVRLTLDEFRDLLHRFDFTRRIDAVHMHHTYRPNRAQYRGEASIEAMWRYHTETKGWSDIAQHVTIGPEGAIWSGRNWNRSPASALGYNGNDAAGPFMFETVGDFDTGRDRLEGPQLEAVIHVIAAVQNRFSLGPDSLRFHRSMTDQKSCPGTSIDLDAMKAAVELARASVRGEAAPRESWAGTEKLRVRTRPNEVMRAWQRASANGSEPPDAELDESSMTEQDALIAAGVAATRSSPSAAARGFRGDELTPGMLASMRPHVINLNEGRFSGEGGFRTTRGDVDAIFDDHLAKAAATASEKEPLRILFWAHGGLISEASGLRIAHQQIEWWKRNRIYPVHFVWETGFLDALRQILAGVRAAAPRGVPRDLWDHTVDPAVEATARTLGAGKIWSAMKRSAELACEADGGARYVAKKLQQFCKGRDGKLELHAVGHSAGSIFHSHFLPSAFGAGVPRFKTLQLLAPAIRVDAFKKTLLGHVGKEIESLTMFTMQRDWEKDDNVAQVYHKSLLYLIYYALEAERDTPILGLEASVRDDRDVATLFGLNGSAAANAEVVWSVTHATSGRDASTSHTHGGFDNDRATMDGVAHRILGEAPAVTFPEEAVERGAELLDAEAPLPPLLFPLSTNNQGNGYGATAAPQQPPPVGPAALGGGRLRALCIGIDTYPTMPLAGCVADARAWADALAALGFETAMLVNEQATRSRILDALRATIARSARGDVVVFQYAGHGTELDDVDGDETQGSNGPKDEALCPYDIADGAFVIDDDLAEVFGAIPDGVNVTCFMDCCHSGTITRVMVGAAADGAAGPDRRARFLPATAELKKAHRRFRQHLGVAGRNSRRRSPTDVRPVLYSACRDYEVAYESAGHGDFTVRATPLLAAAAGAVTHEEFARRICGAFGESARQHPELDCAPSARGTTLFAAVTTGAPAVLTANGRGTAAAFVAPNAAVADALRALADVLAGEQRA